MFGIDFSNLLPEDIGTLLFNASWRILLIAVIAFVAVRLLRSLVRASIRRIQGMDEVDGSELDRRAATIGRVISNTGLVVIIGSASLMTLREMGIEVTPLIASVGVVGLALGLGAQTLVKDVISGLFILMENQYAIGDVISINGTSGTVEQMTLRATYLRDLEGTTHTVPNGDIRTISNITRGWSRAVLDVRVPYETDVDAALDVLREVGHQMENDQSIGLLLEESPVVTGVEDFEDWSVKVRMMVKTEPGQQWAVKRYMRKAVLSAFKARGINIAVPRREIYSLGE